MSTCASGASPHTFVLPQRRHKSLTRSARVVRQPLKSYCGFSRAKVPSLLVPGPCHRYVGHGSRRLDLAGRDVCLRLERIVGRAKCQGRGGVAGLRRLLQHPRQRDARPIDHALRDGQASSPTTRRVRCGVCSRVRSPRQIQIVAIRSSADARLSLIFIAACGRRRGTARRPFWLRMPAPIHCGPRGERLQFAGPQIDTRFEDSRIERHARSLCRQGPPI